jgi:adenylate cyclase
VSDRTAEMGQAGNGAATVARPRMRIGLRVSLIAFAIFTVILTAAAVHLPWMFASRANVAEMADQISNEIVAGVSREIEDIFASAIAAQTTIERILEDGVVDIEDQKTRDSLFLAFLLANKHFSWVSFGKPNGDFYGARRRDDINYRLVESKWDPVAKEARRHMQYLVEDGTDIRRTIAKTKTNEYYAPQRQWYRRAVANPGKNVWTSVYIFASSRKPGLNTARTYFKDGKLVGVVSVAIELERISKYLATIPSVRSGAAFIVDKQGRLLAFKDQSEVTRNVGNSEKLELTPLSEARNPMLKIASAALKTKDGAFAQSSGHHAYKDPVTGRRYFVNLIPLKGRGWYVGTVIPESDFTAAIEANYTKLGIAVGVALILIALAAVWASRQLFVRPLRQITDQTRYISGFELDRVGYHPSRIREIDTLALAVERMSRGLGSFRKYLPTALVRTLLDQGIEAEPSGQRRTLTVLFMDLEGFTAASERMGHRIVPLLSEYLGAMSHIIHEHGGTIDKYIGDAIMAFWGAPQHNDEHAADACRAALACVAAMEKLRADWESQGKPGMRLRIGINTGRVVVGNIGSDERLNYTVVGDPVNLASRLEGVNKTFGTELIVGQHTWELVRYDVVARKLDEVTVRGREEPVGIYEVLDLRGEDPSSPDDAWIAEFEAGLKRYRDGDVAEATVRFQRTIELRGDDAPSRHYLELCKQVKAEDGGKAGKNPAIVSLRSGEPGGDKA